MSWTSNSYDLRLSRASNLEGTCPRLCFAKGRVLDSRLWSLVLDADLRPKAGLQLVTQIAREMDAY